MKIQKAVAMRVSQLLIKNNITPYELSVRANLTKQAIYNILNETYNSVKFDTIVKLADGFGMTLIEFLDDKIFDRKNLLT